MYVDSSLRLFPLCCKQRNMFHVAANICLFLISGLLSGVLAVWWYAKHFMAAYTIGLLQLSQSSEHNDLRLGTPSQTKSSGFFLTLFKRPLTPPHFWTFMLQIILRIIAPNSTQKYTKSATKIFEHGFAPPPPPPALNNVKKKTDDLVQEGVPKT